MKSICVYCGSAAGFDPVYAEVARGMARELVNQDVALVYGGGKVGLMGVIADEVMRLGGSATGIIPQTLLGLEVGHHGLTQLHVVKDMHERKAMMAQLADGFIAMPGGIGTLEELFEALTWAQLGFHDKPVGLLNIAGYYDGLLAFLQHMIQQGFLKDRYAGLLLHAEQPQALLDRLRAHRPGAQAQALGSAEARSLLP